MNTDINNYLLENLNEAHETYVHIIKELKENNVDADYRELEQEENNRYQIITKLINQMVNYVYEADDLKEIGNDMMEYTAITCVKYAALFATSLLFLKAFDHIFDTSKLDGMLRYVIGMFLGGTYIGLLNGDINKYRTDAKEKRDYINKLKTMKEEYKKVHDEAVYEIDKIYAKNDELWNKLDREKVKVKQI